MLGHQRLMRRAHALCLLRWRQEGQDVGRRPLSTQGGSVAQSGMTTIRMFSAHSPTTESQCHPRLISALMCALLMLAALQARKRGLNGASRKYLSQKKRTGFLEGYRQEDNYLIRPLPSKGQPGVFEATSPRGDPVLVRTWPRRTKDDHDLFDIWRHELRQLYRLNGYPGARNCIAQIIDAGSDSAGFYIILNVGQRRPLKLLLERGRGAAEWLRSLNLPANRHRLWSNLQRIARGLAILHDEGLVHRNLDAWSVLTTAGSEPDFLLTGFEWSLRLASIVDAPKRRPGPEVPSVSFSADWAAFASLAAQLFNITPARLESPNIPDYEVHESASAAEVRLLRDLLWPDELYQLDGEGVCDRIDQILTALGAAKSSLDGRYHLVLRVGQDSDLSNSVRNAVDLQFEVDDTDSQLAWIGADLGTPIQLLAVEDVDGILLFARGRELVYRLKQYRAPTKGREQTWQFAFCESAEPVGNWRRRVLNTTVVPAEATRLLSQVAARDVYSRVRGRVPQWTVHIDQLTEKSPLRLSREDQLHRALTLLHTVEVAFAAATSFPMSVLSTDIRTGLVVLAYRPDPDREALSKSLQLDPPLTRLREGLEQELLGEGEGWVLSETARLGRSQAGDFELTYEGREPDSRRGNTRFRFRATNLTATPFHEGYLVPAGARGDFEQFRRRSQAIRLLRNHAELLQSLADPRARVLPSHDVVQEDRGYAQLDEPKQKSLKALSSVLPMYLLQGPPGVGKTFLITDLVRRQFEDDRSTRILATAQGNHPLDHLLDELAEHWKNEPDSAPLAVRCRPRDDRIAPGAFDLHRKTEELLEGLSDARLSRFASPRVRERLRALSQKGTRDAAIANERRSLEALVMRAANLVFATTNSADLERLTEERSQFDWTIVEESGKATGCELVTPLMLSHRRLLIGDHKQLPPFGSEQLESLLGSTVDVKAALRTLPRLIDRAVHLLLDDELLEFIEDDSQDLEALCTDAKRALYLFETLLTSELERQERKGIGLPIASSLSEQHRMHPVICELVSAAFYKKLTTSDNRVKKAREQATWIASVDAVLLPDKPVVFVDMPYERSAEGQQRFESLPRFTNEAEVEEVVRLVANLKVTEKATEVPSLVLLTPYARQVGRLRDAISANAAASAALRQFKPVARGEQWCSTVDAFQGNEADVVIFSLVRNNRGATIRKALGFVGDPRRFNVLISRAKQRFIFVGSYEFLQTVSSPLGLENAPEGEFLRKFLRKLDKLVEDKHAARVVRASRLGGA